MNVGNMHLIRQKWRLAAKHYLLYSLKKNVLE